MIGSLPIKDAFRGNGMAVRVAKTMPKSSAQAGPARAAKAAKPGDAAEAPVPVAKAAPPATVTLKQLAARLAETQDMPKQHAEAVLNGVVGLLVEPSGKATGCAWAASACWRCGTARPAAGATRPPARPCRSRPARKSRSARRRS